jgi:hypothetical protein
MNQFIIDEELTELIEDCLHNVNCKPCPYEGGGIKSGILAHLRSHPYNPQAEQGLWTADELIQHEKMAADAAREKVLDELGKVLNSRIAKMEILDSKNPSPFRKGIIEAYRDIEKWEMARRQSKGGEP